MSPDVAVDTIVAVDDRPPRRRRRPRTTALVAVAVIVTVLVWRPWRDDQVDVRDGTTAVSSAELAARQGVDVNLIAVTAAGGLIELRVQVTDPDKADAALRNPEERPALVAEGSGATLVMANPPHHRAHLELGGQYFFLLANAHNALHKGDRVTLVVGDARVEHLEVQG
jgi:hypothetical protein